MNSQTNRARALLVLAVGVTFLAFTAALNAQVQTATSETKGSPTHEVSVERGEVVYVSGNDLVVKMEDGTIRHASNVPESARVTVDGQQLGVHDLKPGMKLQRTITVTKTPTVVTTVKNVTGKVWQVMPPNSVILTLEDGSNQQFKIPKNQKFNVDGQMTDAWGLKKGMKITATKVVEEPVDVYTRNQQLTGTAPPPPPAPPADVPILVAEATPPPAPVPAAETAELPKTGSILPLFGLLGGFCLLSALGLRLLRSTL
jgi:LPXTG-motif cell wall-anchored protein